MKPDRKHLEEQLRSIVENIPGIAYRRLFDKDRTFLVMSEYAQQVTGFPAVDFIDNDVRTWKSIIHPEDAGYVEEMVNQTAVSGNPWEIEYRIRHKNGDTRWVAEKGRGIIDEAGKVKFLDGVILDITARKQAEEALRKKEQKFKAFMDSSINACSLWDAQLNLMEINGVGLSMFPSGTQKEDILGKNISEIAPSVKETSRYEQYLEVIRTGEPLVIEDFDTHPTWGKKILDITLFKVGDGLGMVARDLTERKRAEEALRREKQFTETLLNSQKDTFFLLEPHTGKAIRWNRVFKEITGYTGEEIDKLPAPASYYSPQDLQRAAVFIDEVMESGIGTIELELICKNGRRIPTEYCVSVVNDKEGKTKYLISIGRDITERKLAEREQEKLRAQLMHAQKMESIGTLAGGIAHNFNNVLMGIQGRTSLLLVDKEPGQRDYQHLKGIDESVQNAAELTKNLLAFARGGKYEVLPTDLNEFIRHENYMFGQTKREINIHGKFQESIHTVEIDHGQIKQMLMNLYVNAWQAMPGGGDLYVQTENVSFDEDSGKPFDISPGRYVKIAVTDTGTGMDETTREKIFDPFFTTHETGTGTGLGLASVYGIVKHHGGYLNVFSEKGLGTTFVIYLPASKKEVVRKKKAPSEIIRGEGTILLVDDEEIVSEVGKEMLEELGYHVLVAGGGKEAVEVYKKVHTGIHLVVLDMIMPGMGGGETFDCLKEINPTPRFLLCSGYSLDDRANEIIERGCDGFIQKPFNLKELSRKIKETLDKE